MRGASKGTSNGRDELKSGGRTFECSAWPARYHHHNHGWMWRRLSKLIFSQRGTGRSTEAYFVHFVYFGRSMVRILNNAFVIRIARLSRHTGNSFDRSLLCPFEDPEISHILPSTHPG